MEYRSQQLDNGLTVVAESNPHSYSAALGIFVRAGSRDEEVEIGGVSHFLEHMVFKGTPNRTAEQVNLELDELGSHSNARTGEDSTIYHATVLPEFQTPVTELLCDLMRPSLRDDDFETEKKVIIEEIMMYDDQPPYGGHEKLMIDYFGQHPLGNSVLGTIDSVSGLTPDRMHEYFKSRYSPNNMAIVGAGNVDFDQLVADAAKCCHGWKSYEARRESQPASPNSGFHSLHKPQSSQQYIMQLGEAPAADDPERFASRLLATIVGDDSGSRMYWKFVDSGLAEAAGLGAYEYTNAGLWMSFLCCAPDQAQHVLEVLYKLQTDIHRDGVSEREISLAKSKISSHLVLSSERAENRMFAVGGGWLKQRDYKTVKEVAEQYEVVTIDDVHQVLQKYDLTTNTTLCVGPKDDLKPANG